MHSDSLKREHWNEHPHRESYVRCFEDILGGHSFGRWDTHSHRTRTTVSESFHCKEATCNVGETLVLRRKGRMSDNDTLQETRKPLQGVVMASHFNDVRFILTIRNGTRKKISLVYQ